MTSRSLSEHVASVGLGLEEPDFEEPGSELLDPEEPGPEEVAFEGLACPELGEAEGAVLLGAGAGNVLAGWAPWPLAALGEELEASLTVTGSPPRWPPNASTPATASTATTGTPTMRRRFQYTAAGSGPTVSFIAIPTLPSNDGPAP